MAVLDAARRHETIPAFRRIEREFAGTPAAEDAVRAIGELRAARRREVRDVERVAIIVNTPPALAAVPIAKAAQEILALAGVEAAPAQDAGEATLRIDLRESTQSASYRRDGRGESMQLVTGATVAGELRFEVRDGAKFSRTFNGRVHPPFALMVSSRSPKEAPPYFEAAGLNHTADVEEPAATFAVRMVRLTAELFGPSVARAALIEHSRFRWTVLRATTLREEPRMVDALIELLPTSGTEQELVVGALGRAGDARAVPPLLRLLARDSHSPGVVQALGRLRDRRAAMPLVELLELQPKDQEFNPDAEDIVRALEQIAGRSFGYKAAAWRKWAQSVANQ